MTIKVCKKKFENRVHLVGVIIANFVCLVFIALVIYGVILLLQSNFNGLFVIFFGGFAGGLGNLMYFDTGKTHWLRLLQNKYKLFEWNNDC